MITGKALNAAYIFSLFTYRLSTSAWVIKMLYWFLVLLDHKLTQHNCLSFDPGLITLNVFVRTFSKEIKVLSNEMADEQDKGRKSFCILETNLNNALWEVRVDCHQRVQVSQRIFIVTTEFIFVGSVKTRVVRFL